MLKAVGDKWQESEIIALKATATEKAALEKVEQATRNAKTAAEERATALSDGAALAAMDAELQKAKAITAEMQRQTNLAREKRQLENEVLDAKDQADMADVDLDEASGKLTKDQAAKKRADIEGAARKRDRDERKERVIEDSVNSAGEAVVKTEAAQKARNVANDLSQKTTAAEANAAGISDYTSKEIGKIVPDKKTGQLSDSDKKFVDEMKAEVTRAQNLLTELSKASKEATSAADKADKEASDARRDAGDKGTRATQTVAALDQVQSADDQRLGTQSKTRAVKTAAEKKKEADDARRKEQERQEKARDARRDFEGYAAQIGNQAGKAAGELGARSGVVDGLKRLGTAISKPGDAKGDDKALNQIMSMVESLISHAEASGKGGDPATDSLRGLEERIRKAEQRIKTAEAQIKNARNGH